MEAVSGVFGSRSDAEHAMAEMRAVGLGDHQIALLTPEGGGYRLSMRPAPGKPYGLAAANFFGSGKVSLAVSNSESGTVTLLTSAIQRAR